MARMIPPFISADVKSSAERKLFEVIKKDPLAEYVVLHSLGLSTHQYKRQAEIDFVVVGEGLILCLEVKGGRVSQKEGVWFFTDRFGQSVSKTEGPFAQASSAMFSLRSLLHPTLGESANDIMYGYGVLFPDVEFAQKSPEWDPAIVYDIRDSKKPFSAYIARLKKYWESKLRRVGFPNTHLSTKKIVAALRSDFELSTPLWLSLEERNKQIVRFTEEQFVALDQMEDNRRVIFKGGAGTGKTFLAVEKAHRLLRAERRSLLLCFNKYLGSRLSARLEEIDPGKKYIFVDSVHHYFLSHITKAGLKKEFSAAAEGADEEQIYNKIFPEFFARASALLPHDRFSCLIIDEGQDVLTVDYLLALDSILSGGLSEGEWYIFMDPGAQGKLFNRFSSEAYEYLRTLGITEYKLGLNCRNTLQIATQTAFVSGFPMDRTRAEGPRVDYSFYSNEREEAEGVVALLKKIVSEEGVPPHKVTLLSAKGANACSLFTTGIILPAFVQVLDEKAAASPPNDKVLLASVQSFKGLENDIVIFFDLDVLDGEWHESVNYVAMTRAKYGLYVFLNKKCKKSYEQRIKKIIEV